MAEIHLSKAARRDLVDIRLYSIAQFDADTVDRYFEGFDSAFALLVEHPRAGAPTPEYGKAMRCLVHDKHRIFYRVEKGRVLIVRVLHHARDARRAMAMSSPR